MRATAEGSDVVTSPSLKCREELGLADEPALEREEAEEEIAGCEGASGHSGSSRLGASVEIGRATIRLDVSLL